MAEPVVSLVLETVTKLLIEEKKLLSGVRGEAEKLRSELQMMQAFLRDADKKQHDEARVKSKLPQEDFEKSSQTLWPGRREYEAENVLEDFAFKLSSRRRGKGILSAVKRFARILNECIIRHNVGVEIQGLNTRISTLTQHFQDYGIMKALTRGEGSSSSAVRQQQSRVTYSFVANDEDIVGIKADIEKMVEALVEKSAGVVSITGMGGSGKTTLARKVFNHPTVKSHFDGFAWVCVSQQWETRKVLEEILASFLPPAERIAIPGLRDDEIVERLVRFQQDKKCLVVLDDVWADDVWKCIKHAFSHSCKMIVTTRNENVGTQIGPSGYHHRPKFLNDDQSLELLLKKAFAGNTPDQELEDIESLKRLGKEMVKTCGGLPLAVVVLGGILASKKKVVEWEAVSKDLQSQKSTGDVQDILALSYNDLPYSLKPCFLYLSVLAEDERMDGDRLYNLWIAEGMVLAEDRRGIDESIREVARRYLGELVKRCIVMVEASDEDTLLQHAPVCYLHDLMRDMCRAKAREENFAKVLDYGSGDMGLDNSPRVMINSLSPENVLKFNDQMDGGRSLRALGFRAKNPVDLMVQMKGLGIRRFTMLRSLILEGVMDPMVENIKAGNQMADGVFELPVGKLIHLRQLSLRKCELLILPSSISNLEHLEILDLDGSTIIWTKKHEIMTSRLRHLVFPLDIEIGTIPAQIISVSKDLEVIHGQIPNRRLRVKNLSQLTNLRELGFIYFENYHEVQVAEDLFKCILNSHHLKEVGFQDWTRRLFMEEKGSVLVRNLLCSNVRTIFLANTCLALPEYNSHFARNLTRLMLIENRIKEDPMKLLELFPHLQELEFSVNAFSGKEMVCHSMGFPNLRSLVLGGLTKLERWTVEKGAMPNLRSLVLGGLTNLERWTVEKGAMPNLRSLVLIELTNLERWTVEKGAMPNLFQLEIAACRKLKEIPQELRFIPTLKELVLDSMPEKFMEESRVNFRHVPSIRSL